MSFGSSLLRVLLCLALALNGVSSARAGMHPGHAMPADAAQSATLAAMGDMAGMPCHDMGQGGDTDHPQPVVPDPDGDKSPAQDCCKGGCQCACLQHATPAIVAATLPALVTQHASLQPAPSAHAAPAMLRLNRPPIG